MRGALPLLYLLAFAAALFHAPPLARAGVYEDDVVTTDGAIAFWGLGETTGPAVNTGSIGSAVDGTYYGFGGGAGRGEPSLLVRDPHGGAAAFDGSGDYVDIPSNAAIDGGPHAQRTIGLTFNPEGLTAGSDRRILYEEGGSTRGLNVYVHHTGGGDFNLYVGGWNVANDGDAGTPWPSGAVFRSTPIAPQNTHMVHLVLDGTTDGTGTLTGYLNGVQFGQATGVGRLFAHSEASIGAKDQGTKFDWGDSGGTGNYFDGTIDEVFLTNSALTPARVAQHFTMTQPYMAEVLGDDPIAYWRLGEPTSGQARNIAQSLYGSGLGRAADAPYQGGVTQGVGGVLSFDPDGAARFDGSSGYVHPPDVNGINNGGPWTEKTVELWFIADTVTTTEQVIYEQGGATRGLSIYTLEDGGQDKLFMGMWSKDASQDPVWEIFLDTPIQEGKLYHAALVLASNAAGDGSGLLFGYLNGGRFGWASGANRLFAHGNDTGIGAMVENVVFASGDAPSANFVDYYFDGLIDDLALYNTALSHATLSRHYRLGLVPEPASVFLLGLGGLAFLRRRRRGSASAKSVAGGQVPLVLLVALVLVAGGAQAGLVAQWKADEGAGTFLADSAGGHNAQGQNWDGDEWLGVGLPPVPSGTTAALDFDGSDDFAQVSDGWKGVTGTDSRSMSAWIRTTSENAAILNWGTNSNGQKWTWRVQDSNGPVGTLRVEVNGGYQVGDTYLADGQWHHVAATWEGDNVEDVRLWVDGTLQGVGASQGNGINTASGVDVRIANDFNGGRKFTGGMDEVRIYDHALDRQEVRALAGLGTDAYWQAVQDDGPIAYYRLGEASGGKAFSEGSLGSAVDASYAGGPSRGQPSLVPTITNPSVAFDGGDDRVEVPNHGQINTSGPYSNKSFEAWFSTEAHPSGTNRRVLYEQGGTTNGFNLYTQLDGGTYYLRYGAWAGGTSHFPSRVPVTPDTAYHAVAVYDDGDNSYTLYLNGVPVSAKTGGSIGSIPSHGGRVAIGAKRNDTRFDSGNSGGSGNRFWGTIDEVALYNSSLGLQAIQTHYVAATGDRLGLPERVTLGAALNYDAGLDTDGDTDWEDTIGTRPNGAGLNQFDWGLSGVERKTAASRFFITHAYEFDGSDSASMQSLESIAGDPTNNSATFELLFAPTDFSGDEVIFETGGSADGLSVWLEDSVLHFDAKNGNKDAQAWVNLNDVGLAGPGSFIHAVGVADLDAEEARLYLFGQHHHTASAGLDDLLDWAGSNGSGLGSVNGSINFGSAGAFAGRIALLRFYPWALSDEQIWQNYSVLVPEPTTLGLLGLGGLGLLARRRRRRRDRSAKGPGGPRGLAMLLLAALCLGLGADVRADKIVPNNLTLNFEASHLAADPGPGGDWMVPTTSEGRRWRLGSGTADPTWVAASGNAGMHLTDAFDFDGLDDYMIGRDGGGTSSWLEGLSGNPTDNDATFEVWFKPASLSGGQQVVFENGGSGDGVSITLDNADLRFQVKDGGTLAKATHTLSSAASVVQAVGVYNKNTPNPTDTLSLYVDGQPVASDASQTGLNDWSGSNQAGLGAIQGGSINSGSGEFDLSGYGNLDGEVSIFRFYQRALSPAQVLQNYNDQLVNVATRAYDYDADNPGSDPANQWQPVGNPSPGRTLSLSGVDHVSDASTKFFTISSAYRFDNAADRATASSFGAGNNVLYDGPDSNDEKSSASFEVWFKPSASNWSDVDDQILFETGGGNGVGLVLEDIAGGARLTFQIQNSSGSSNKGPYSVSYDLLDATANGMLGAFTQAVGVVDPFDPTGTRHLRLYVNGALVDFNSNYTKWWDASGDGGGVGSLGGSNMGGFGGGNQGFGTFLGDIALVRLYDAALSDQAVGEAFQEVVPEPTTLGLLGLGGLGLLARRRRRHGRRRENPVSSRGGHLRGILILALALAVASTPARAGLVAHWKLDEGAGTSLADATGNHPAAGQNWDGDEWIATDLPPVPSGTVAAVELDRSSNDYAQVTDGYKGVTGTNDRSITAWIKTPAGGNLNRDIVSWGSNSPGQKWHFRVQDSNGTAGAIRAEVNGGYIVSQDSVADGTWHHVAVTWADDGSPNITDGHLYIDGARQTFSAQQGQGMNTASGDDVRIGTSLHSRYFDGQVDDVRIYDHALTRGEVRVLHTGRAYEAAVVADGPIAYWTLDEASASNPAINYGSLGPATDGTYQNSPTMGAAPLVPTMPDTAAVAFSAASQHHVSVPNHGQINSGGPYPQKTLELWFQAGSDIASRQVLYEQGGAGNGLNLYIEDGLLHVGAWAGNGGTYAHFLDTPIASDTPYHAALVFDATNDAVSGYLNGILFGRNAGTGLTDMPQHIGLIGIAAMLNDTRIDDGTASGQGLSGAGLYFTGILDEIALYNTALTTSEIKAHYAAGVPEPGTVSLLGLGGLGLLARRRRRRRSSARRATAPARSPGLWALLLAALLVAGGSARAGLVAHWKLDKGAGTSLADATGNHPAAGQNWDGDEWITTGLAPIPSGTVAAVEFGGGDDFAQVTDGYKGVTATNDRSATAWIKTTNDTNHAIISWGRNQGGRKWTFRVQDNNGTHGAIRTEVNGGYIVSRDSVADGAWHHVAVTWADDGTPNITDGLLYIDGVRQRFSAQQGQAINTASFADVRIGLDHSGRHFDGQMDDVRIYDHALTPGELRAEVAGYRHHEQAVLADGPIAYWTLDETSSSEPARNYGTLGEVVNGTYFNAPTLGVDRLVPTSYGRTAAQFDATSSQCVDIPDHGQINSGSSYAEKTVELWFQAGDDITSRQVLYEQGGGVHGLNLYIEGGEVRLGVWRNSGNDYAHFLRRAIAADTPYHVALVFDQPGDALTGYLNGLPFAALTGTGLTDLLKHTGDVAIGAMRDSSRFYDGSATGIGRGGDNFYFTGVIDDVALYNAALTAQQVGHHYASGIPEPGTLSLLGLGGLGLLARRRRRRAHRAA